MMSGGWGFFPWTLMFVFTILVATVVFLAVRAIQRGNGMSGGWGPAGLASRAAPNQPAPIPAPVEDPMVLLRDRFVRGEIGMAEFDARLQALLKSAPHEAMPWWDNPIPPAASYSARTTR